MFLRSACFFFFLPLEQFVLPSFALYLCAYLCVFTCSYGCEGTLWLVESADLIKTVSWWKLMQYITNVHIGIRTHTAHRMLGKLAHARIIHTVPQLWATSVNKTKSRSGEPGNKGREGLWQWKYIFRITAQNIFNRTGVTWWHVYAESNQNLWNLRWKIKKRRPVLNTCKLRLHKMMNKSVPQAVKGGGFQGNVANSANISHFKLNDFKIYDKLLFTVQGKQKC